MLPSFHLVHRKRPIDLVAAISAQRFEAGTHPLPRPAPSAAVTADVLSARTWVEFSIGSLRWRGWVDPQARRTGMEVHGANDVQTVSSRRHGRIARGSRVKQVGLTLTGRHLALLTSDDREWTIRARIDLQQAAPELDVHAAATLAQLQVSGSRSFLAGGFGQLGLRDVRWVTTAAGEPERAGELLLFSATHAGPGFFDTGHTGVWSLDPQSWEIAHRADLFFRRRQADGRLGNHGDHASQVLRVGEEWWVATSTWSDFDLSQPQIRALLARTSTAQRDLTRGEHLLVAEELPLPIDGLASRGVWDPHLAFDGDRWLVGFVSAQEFFRFHPALAAGRTLTELQLLGADPTRVACEGVTLLPPETTGATQWTLAASDGPDSARQLRRQYPIFDLSMAQRGTIDAPHLSNIPWPSVLKVDGRQLLLSFDGTPAGGRLVDYGTHGDLLVMVGEDHSAPQDQPR